MSSRNYPGVHVKGTNFHQDSRKLAGYLHLANTSELRDFISSDAASPIINPFLSAVDKCFGHTGPDPRFMRAVRVHRVMESYNEPDTQDHVNALQTVDEICTTPDRSTGVAVYVFTIKALINAFPARFNDPNRAEDVHRCVCLLKYILKSQAASRKVKRGHQNQPAIIPEYRAVDSGGHSTATQVNEPPNDEDAHLTTRVAQNVPATSASEGRVSPA